MITLAGLEVFFFILARLAGIFILAPFLSSRSFNTFAKACFVVWFSLVLWFVVPVSTPLPSSFLQFALTLIAEVALGFLIGFVAHLIFIAIQAAGEIIDLQMGLSVASALDPVFGAVISIIGRLTFFTALTLFVLMDGHHLLLSAFHQSFTAVPAGRIANFASPGLTGQLMELGAMLWLTSIKIAVPIILLIFLADFSFGIVSRVAPQVNVFMLGFQVKPILGLFGISLTLPFLVRYIGRFIESIGAEIVKLLAFVK